MRTVRSRPNEENDGDDVAFELTECGRESLGYNKDKDKERIEVTTDAKRWDQWQSHPHQ